MSAYAAVMDMRPQCVQPIFFVNIMAVVQKIPTFA